jgi:hypothetical protein
MKQKHFVILICILFAIAKTISGQTVQKESKYDRLMMDKKLLHSDSTSIILTFGQSNSANHGQGSYECHNQVLKYFNGDLYQAKEPLLGASGNGCSVWTRFSDLLIDGGLYKRVIIIPIGIGSSTCAQKEFIFENKEVLPGPNTDLIDLATDRYDGVHFSERGLDKFTGNYSSFSM